MSRIRSAGESQALATSVLRSPTVASLVVFTSKGGEPVVGLIRRVISAMVLLGRRLRGPRTRNGDVGPGRGGISGPRARPLKSWYRCRRVGTGNASLPLLIPRPWPFPESTAPMHTAFDASYMSASGRSPSVQWTWRQPCQRRGARSWRRTCRRPCWQPSVRPWTPCPSWRAP